VSAPAFVCDQSDRAAWLEHRRTGIGASEAPAILGISPFSSPAKLAAEKAGLVALNDTESELMAWGRKVEPLLLETFAEDMEKAGQKGWSVKLSGQLYRSTKPGREIMLSTLDGEVRDPAGRYGIAECKLKIFGAQEWERNGIPDHVIAQTQHAMDVMDVSFAVVIGLLDGYRPRWKIVERSQELLEDVIVPAELAWWEKYLAGEAFPMDQGPGHVNLDLVGRLYPDDDGSTVKLKGPLLLEVAEAWRGHAEVRLAATKAEEAAKAVLRQAIGDATYGILDNGQKLSLKTTKKGPVTQKATSFRTLREVAAKKGRRR
jgi:putative phage-type endonuclease